MLIEFAERPVFSGLGFFNEPEISNSGPGVPRTCAQDFYILKKNPSTSAGFKPANLGSQGEVEILIEDFFFIFRNLKYHTNIGIIRVLICLVYRSTIC